MIANKYGINLKGSGQKISIVFNPTLVSEGKIREITLNVIEIGPRALVSEEELANTIAHELNHAGNTLAAYIRGEL